ncbi:hypothetical protein [Mycolicibacterium thermoresistibile]
MSARRIGNLGGWAVALGVGAALTAPGIAHAEAGEGPSAGSDASSHSSDTGSQVGANDRRSLRTGSATGTAERTRPQTTFGARVQKPTSPTTEPATRTAGRAKPTAEEFEAEQVDRLQKMLRPRKAAAVLPDRTTEPDDAVEADDAVDPAPIAQPAARAAATAPAAAAAAPEPEPAPAAILEPDAQPEWNWNPFRPDDPAPFSMPPLLQETEKAFVAMFPEIFQPVAREGFEAVYRGSQMVPWVNVVVPLTQIVQQLPDLMQGDDDAKRAMQVVVNELLVTTGPVSFLYYGYDQVADLLNVEYPAQQTKEWFYTTAWDTLDWFELLHVRGESGLRDGIS